MKITEALQEFDSFDSFLIHVFQSGNDIAVPYANLVLSGEHPANALGDTAYLSRAVLLVRGLDYLKVNDDVVIGERPDFLVPVSMWGGINLMGEAGVQEFEFSGGEAAVFLPEQVEFSLSPFPHPDPADMSSQDHFFLHNTGFDELEQSNWAPVLPLGE